MEKLSIQFEKSIKTTLKKELKKNTISEVPELEKVVISVGIGDIKEDKGAVEKVVAEVARITGQKPKINLSRKAVSAFKLRVGQPVGITSTLRGERMYDFVSRLINLAFPRVRDFRGLPLSAFDGKGNYSIGIREYAIFPEVKYENISTMFGFQVNLKTTAKNDTDAKALLVALGFPFEKK